MPRYNARPRKARSTLQKAHTQSLLVKGDARSPATESSSLGGGPYASASYERISPTVVLKQKNKKFDTLKKQYKSSIQREKRAKIKVCGLALCVTCPVTNWPVCRLKNFKPW